MSKTKLMLGNNIDSLKKLPDNSIDSVVTDPPYGISFMNRKWDYDVPSVVEMDEDYFKIASARIENFEKYRKFLK